MRRVLSTLLCGVAVLPAQEPPTLKVETRVVQINVAVKDSEGRPVRDLRKEDFTVTDNGKRRAIQLFSGEEETGTAAHAVALPPNEFSNRRGLRTSSRRVTAILIDAINTPFEHQSVAREQAIKAVERMTSGEVIALYAMAPELAILQDYTSDRDLLLKALRAYWPRQPRQPDRSGEFQYRAELATPGRGPSAAPRRRSPLAEFLLRERIEMTLESLRTIAGHMAAANGRKSIVWITAGFGREPNFSQQIQSAVAAINEANVAIYPIDARGLVPSLAANINIALMQEFAQSTGGQAYYNRNDLDRALEEAIDDARYTYFLGFYLTDQDLDGQYHNLKVTANRPGLTLHHRRGYSTVENTGNSKDGLETELLNPVDSAAVGIDARVEIAGGRLKINLALARETVTRADPLKIEEMLVVTDACGYMLARVSGKLGICMREGDALVRYVRSMQLPDGAVKLQVIVRDTASRRTGSLTIPLASVAGR